MFQMRLAERLHMMLTDVQTKMSNTELMMWFAKDQLEIPPDQYYIMGQICASIFNASGHSKRRYKPKDFIPKIKRAMTENEMKRSLGM